MKLPEKDETGEIWPIRWVRVNLNIVIVYVLISLYASHHVKRLVCVFALLS